MVLATKKKKMCILYFNTSVPPVPADSVPAVSVTHGSPWRGEKNLKIKEMFGSREFQNVRQARTGRNMTSSVL
jgi:hypothetical protein